LKKSGKQWNFLISGCIKCACFNGGQVHEKKVKKICDMNVDPAKAAGNGPVVGPSIPTSSKPYTANGGCLDKPLGLSNDFSFPLGGVPSLHLPVVVVFTLIYVFAHGNHDFDI
jgi:hypothetical protein